MMLWVGILSRSPGFCNLCENLQQLSKRRAAFRFLEKGSRGGQLSLRLTQTPALELAGRTRIQAGSPQMEEKDILAGTQDMNGRWARHECENVTVEGAPKVE